MVFVLKFSFFDCSLIISKYLTLIKMFFLLHKYINITVIQFINKIP